MTRLPPQHIIVNLKQQLSKDHYWYMTYQEAYAAAVLYSKVDFGDDIEQWGKWFEKYPRLVGIAYSELSLKSQCKLLLKNLRQEIPPKEHRKYLSVDHALGLLQYKTKQDFGDDIKRWEAWIEANLAGDNSEGKSD